MIRQNDGQRSPSINISSHKEKRLIANILPSGCALSPDIKPPGFSPQLNSVATVESGVKCVGKYILVEKVSASTTAECYKACHTGTRDEFVCKVFPLNKYREHLAPYWQCGSHPHIANIEEIVLGESNTYVFFKQSYEDLHSYIRTKRRLKEKEAAVLLSQIATAIKHCHKRGIVLRDIKLRKFVFIDQQRTHLVLDGLEDACLLDDFDDDVLTDKHGCPAYVSPEILSFHGYSGRAADMWSLGVILYTMLFGQYPFHDTVASQLFGKIRRGHYTIPDSISTHARCLVRSLLRTEPTERLNIREVCRHPWFNAAESPSSTCTGSLSNLLSASKVLKDQEQRVPQWSETPMSSEDIFSN